MKFSKLFKKAAAALMAAVTALSVMPATTAFAAGDIGTISFSHTYDSSGNAMRYNSSAVINGYTAGGTGNYKYRMFVDGETAFCIQPGVPLKTGNTLKKESSDTWNALTDNQKKAVGLALLYGYQGNKNSLSGSDDEKWLATQTLVWEFVTGCRKATGSYNQTSTTVYSLHFGSNYANSGARAVYDQIVSLMSEHNTIPSFMAGGKNDITKELSYKDGQYSITLTDKNGVLSDYSFTSSDANVSVSKDGNKLTISSQKAISSPVRITATRNGVPTVSDSAKLIAYGDPNLQDVVTGVENADGVKGYINVETPTGTIALKKTSEDGVVAGISFHIKGDGFDKTVKTDENGNLTVEGLFPATYTITEQSIDRYEPQQTQTVTLIGGKTTTVNFNNILKRGSLEVIKTSEDSLVEGVTFHLYGTSLSGLPVDEYAVTDKNGVAKFENVLISGNTPYVVEEVDTAVRYVVPESQTAPIEWNKVTSRSFTNILKKFNVTVTKSDVETGTAQGDGTLAGAVYGIYKGEELIDTYTTDENGQFTTKYYVCGDDWTIREISPSEGYLIDSTIHKVGAKAELYTVEYNAAANDVTEQVIKGNIAIIKHTDNGETQIETPEEGAVFEVFLKSAGSYEAAKETERDILTCDENGFAQTQDMPYGIYTVKQTSGWEGRELMKPFDVFISKDGQTCRYLINNANFESYIKIVKKDAETGNTIPYAGAGFQIYDPDGNLVTMTFTYPEVTTIDTFYLYLPTDICFMNKVKERLRVQDYWEMEVTGIENLRLPDILVPIPEDLKEIEQMTLFNEMCQAVKRFDEVKMNQLAMVAEFTGFNDFVDVTYIANHLGEFEINPFVHNDEEYGKFLVTESGLFDVDELLLPHINYASFAADKKEGTLAASGYAQFWGVPQRRNRIFLVADFGGHSAGEILFESDSVWRNYQKKREERKGVACYFKTGTTDAGRTSPRKDYVICLLDQGGERMDVHENKSGTLLAHGCSNPPIIMATSQGNAEIGIGYCPTITAAAGMAGNNQPILFDNHGPDTRYTGPVEVAQTITSALGTGGNNTPLAVNKEPFCIISSVILSEVCVSISVAMKDTI